MAVELEIYSLDVVRCVLVRQAPEEVLGFDDGAAFLKKDDIVSCPFIGGAFFALGGMAHTRVFD